MNSKCIALLALFAAALISHSATAGIIDDFQFNEANGTVITGTANSATPAHTWLSENTAVNSSVFNGAFRIQKTTPTSQVGNTFDIVDASVGKIWLVAEIKGWFYTETPSTTSERVRFAFLDNATPAAGSNTITAEMDLDRNGTANIGVAGDAGGAGSTATLPVVGDLARSRDTLLTMVLEVDHDTDLYTVYYKDGANPFTLVGTGNIGERTVGVKREARSVRFAFTGTYDSANGEFVDVDRIYVTDMNPIPEPGTLMMLLVAGITSLAVARRRA